MMAFGKLRYISQSSCRVLSKQKISPGVRLRHQGAILAAGKAMLDPGGILVTGSTDSIVERTAAQPTKQNIFVRKLATVLTFLFSQDQIKHKIHEAQTNARRSICSSRSLPSYRTIRDLYWRPVRVLRCAPRSS